MFNAGSPGSGAIVQVLPNQGQVDADVASFIVTNTGGSSSPYGWLDGQLGKAQPVASNPNAGLNSFTPASNGCASAECAAGVAGVRNVVRTINDVPNDVRNNVADGAAVVIRGSDITAAASTMAAAVPGPHQPGAVTTAVVATGVGFVANVVEQVARPDAALSSENAFYMAIQIRAEKIYPIAAPITNEVINAWKNSNTNLELKEWANIEWRKFVDSRSKP